MPRRPKFEIKEQDGKWILNVPPSFSASGKRERYARSKLADAKKLQRQVRKKYHELGTRASNISAGIAEDATAALELLKPFNVSLLEAAREFVKKRKAAGATIPLREAWADFIVSLEEKGRSADHIDGHRKTIALMPEWFLDTEVAAIEGGDLEKALDETIRTRPITRGPTWNRRLREVRSVLNWAKNTEAKENRTKRKPPKILKDNDQARLLMRLAEEDDCALPFALMLFAGIRPKGELSRIGLQDIRRKYIYVGPDEAKTGSDRQIPISGNLRLWIKAWDQETILPHGWQKRCQAIRRAAGIAGQQDILRHSFGSNFYRIHGEQETLLAMGHGNWQTFVNHYKRAVSLERAREFFTIAPGGKSCAAPQAIKVA
jgi:hypothetical protein|tara:strand:- start:370 stop:1494 length:1125 start_codon:yes stop_codon:yes gene_type:complete